jgi:predicted RNA-binding Zn-ribbon protein involved in translation (DUF1610 family)
LIKHYYLEGIVSELLLREKILEYLKANYEGYKRAKWEETISKIVHNYLGMVKRNKIDVKIIDITEIDITKQELIIIEYLEDIKLEKLAFIMLVYAKISNIMMDNTEGWINKSCSVICKEAKVNLKGIEKDRIFNELYKIEYIKQRKNTAKTNMKVCYVLEDSEVMITIKDFKDVIYQYLIWKGERWKKCEVCGRWIKVKGKKPQQYCPNCKKNKQLEWDREYRKRLKNE